MRKIIDFFNSKLSLLKLERVLAVLVLLSLSFFLRVFRLDYPPEPYFDEVYHLPAVRLIKNNDPRVYEWWHAPIYGQHHFDWLHPPLAKLIQAGSVGLFGWKTWAWRLPSALAGTALVGAVYWVANLIFKELFKQKEKSSLQAHQAALLAALLTSIEGLVLVQSRVAMNDIFVSLFMVLSAGLFLKSLRQVWLGHKRAQLFYLLLTGSSLGLGLATKWSAGLLLFGIVLLQAGITLKQQKWRWLPFTFFSLLLLPLAIYLLSYVQMFLQGKNLGHFWQLHQQIFWYQTHREAGHLYASQPWQWFLNLRPVWYWHEKFSQANQVSNIYALSNPILTLLTVPALLMMGWRLWRALIDKKKLKVSFNLSYLLGVYLISWVPWIFSPRVMFFYHYLPALPFLIIIISYFLWRLKTDSELSFWSMLTLISLGFIMFYPHWVGLPVSKTWVEAVYFSLETWK